MKPKISLKNFEVEQITKSSGVFQGLNVHQGFTGLINQNHGLGTVDGNRNKTYNTSQRVIRYEQRRKNN